MVHIVMFRAIVSVLILYLLSIASPCHSANAQENQQSAEEIVKQLRDYYRSIDSLSFTFIQTTEGQMVGRPKKGRGTGLFVRLENGRKMRWNYSDPDKQVLISDGSTISMYFEELRQMIIAPVSQSQADILFSFFGGQGDLENNFTILDTRLDQADESIDTEDLVKVVNLIPNSADSQLAMITIYVTEDMLIRRITLIDHFETNTTISIANIVINPFASKSAEEIEALFSFSPPEGTEIIRQ